MDDELGARFALYDFDIDAGLADDYAHLRESQRGRARARERERQRGRARARERERVADYNGERGLSSHMAHVRR